jgi:hypothetical protein
MDRQVLDRGVGPESEQQPQDADDQPGEQDLVAGHAEEIALIQIRQLNVHFTTGAVLRLGLCGQQRRRHQYRQRTNQGHSLNQPYHHRVP